MCQNLFLVYVDGLAEGCEKLYIYADQDPFSQAWTGFMRPVDNYFEGVGDNARLVIVMDQAFHSCGWNTAGHIELGRVGSEAYRTLVSVVLTAIVSGRSLAVAPADCIGDRVNIVGLKLGS